MADMASPTEYVYVSPATATAFAASLLEAHSMPPAHAHTVATHLVMADLRGVDTHGILRLPSYLARVRSGALSATAVPTTTSTTPFILTIDAHNSFGQLAADTAMRAAIGAARAHGLAMVAVKHSNHFGASASYVQLAVDAGMLCQVYTNSSPAMPPFGGRDRLLGVSPIAAGAPGEPPFVLDMAPSVAARGKVHKALRRGEQIPGDWALDADGRPTTDPAAALEPGATMLPMAGPKGSALAIMMDVFSGVLTGSAFAGDVVGPYDAARQAERADVGHWMLVFKPEVFIPLDEFRERMRTLYERVVGGRRREGCERIWFPGERELVEVGRREVEGIPFTRLEVGALDAEADRVGVQRMETAGRKLGVSEEPGIK
ncbi:Malate/L-lactate dehydrogenase [Geopyxis carbonaria]|nr:Malate/L-lactate dehydrogenase [Geopyxis carbonaria]